MLRLATYGSKHSQSTNELQSGKCTYRYPVLLSFYCTCSSILIDINCWAHHIERGLTVKPRSRVLVYNLQSHRLFLNSRSLKSIDVIPLMRGIYKGKILCLLLRACTCSGTHLGWVKQAQPKELTTSRIGTLQWSGGSS